MNIRALLVALLALPLLAHAGSGVLREDTATQVAIGPFLDGTDGVTAETALTVTEWDCDLVKHADSSMAATALTITASAGSNDAVHLQSGVYSLELTATDTNTAGRLILVCDHATPTTFMPVRHEWMVMPTQEYDSLYGTDVQQVHVVEFTANVIDAASLAADAGTEIGTATWASATRTLTAATNITSTGGTTVPQTGDSFARLGAPAGASVSADIAAVPTAGENVTELFTQQRVLTGTCDSGSTTTCVDDALTQAAESQLDDRLICFSDSWCALITGFTPGTDTVTTTKVAPSTRASLGYTIFPATAQ